MTRLPSPSRPYSPRGAPSHRRTVRPANQASRAYGCAALCTSTRSRTAVARCEIRAVGEGRGRRLAAGGCSLASERGGSRRVRAVAERWLLGSALGLEPAGDAEKPARPNWEDKWRVNVTAARQFRARAGHLAVPRQHVEVVEGAQVRLGTFVDIARRRAVRLAPERRAEPQALGMRWKQVRRPPPGMAALFPTA